LNSAAESFKRHAERQAGDKFVALHPACAGYSFHRYGENAQPHNEPDLLYMDAGGSELWIEASEVHFNADAGKFEAMGAQRRPDAPKMIFRSPLLRGPVPIGASLLGSLVRALEKKSEKTYSKTPILLLHHPERSLDDAEYETLLADVTPPATHPFSEIFFMVTFCQLQSTRLWKIQ
jgi:hypothetical protein